jgi:hypothetical protein
MPDGRHGGVVNDRSRPNYPKQDDRGNRLSGSAAARPPARHGDVVRNAGFMRGITRLQRTEMVPNHYYWHNDHGIRYSHYFDGHNHWYGFYHGPAFYWTRFYGDRWWFFDVHAARWVFWGNGFWWWAGPGGVPYVYADDNYYPYEDSGVTVEDAETVAPPASVPAEGSAQGASSISPDKTRMVQVFGDDAQAFLYDQTATPPKFMKYLGQGVTKVRFSGGTANAPLQIMVEYKDGTFALFDASGNSQSEEVKTDESGTTPPPAPDSIPPPPSSAPGE